MSFRINTNLSAMTALNSLNQNGEAFNQSVTRLSTGLRINSAADDPAGLVIANQFQAQLTGISQALSNNQDGINYLKTAEGALDEVNSLLNTARGLAVSSANSATLDSPQIQANETQLQSIMASITRISQQTQFGTKHLLDGSAGVSASITDAASLDALNIGGQFNGTALTQNSAVTLNVTTAATQAVITVANANFTAATSLVSAGSFTINGTTFTTSASDTIGAVIQEINQASGQTGVTAVLNPGNGLQLYSTTYGSKGQINVTDSNGVLYGAATNASAAGTDAVATVTINGTNVTFTGGLNGNDGLTLMDSDGNSLRLTEAGNNAATGAILVGQVLVGSATFQIGANPNQTATFSLANFAASQLGTGAVTGKNLSNIDFNTAADATVAMQVIDQAINQVSSARGGMGAFESDVLQANAQSLTAEQQNLTATYSSIMDTDVAAEMTNFTREQILQQAGVSVLAQANAAPQAVLKLLQ